MLVYLHYSTQGSVMVSTTSIIAYNHDVLCNANTLNRSLKISSIIHWNMFPAGTTLSGSLVNLCLPNWHVYVVGHNDFLC